MQSLVILILHFVGAAVSMVVLNAVALAASRWKRAEHWSEQARRLHPVRSSAFVQLVCLPVFMGIHYGSAEGGSIATALGVAVASLAGGQLGCYPLDRVIHPMLTFRTWLSTVGGFWVLQLSAWLLLVAGIIVMPDRFNFTAVLVAIGVFGFHAAFIAGLGLKLGRWLGVISDAPPALRELAEVIAAKAGLVPRTLVLTSAMPNAFAFPQLRTLLFTSRVVDELSPEEIAAVAAHEVGHLSEPRRVIWARIAMSFAYLPMIFMKPFIAWLGLPGLFIVLAVIFLFQRTAVWLGRKMEVRADALAAAHSDVESATYARALEHLYELGRLPAVMPGRQVHPHLYDRLIAAGVTPDFPRPKKPWRFSWTTILLFLGVIFFLVFEPLVSGWLRGAQPDTSRKNSTTRRSLHGATP